MSVKRRSPFLANLDMYRKVPVDLLEGSKQGSLVSWIALLVMFSLTVFETRDFFMSSLQTDLTLDPSKDLRVSVNFNITMLDLSCDYATIDVVSFLGTKQENVTKNVQKWAVNADGVAQSVVHRNKRQHDIRLSDVKVTKTIEELHDNGVHAVPLDATTLQFAFKEHEFVFLDFYASWCSHCQIFAPTWETLAEIMDDAAEQRMHSQDYKEHDYQYAKTLELPVFVGKVDCVLHNKLCSQQEISGFPTVRLYIDGERYVPDYWGHRDVYNMMMFLKIAEENTKGPARIAHAESIAKHRMNITDEEKKWTEQLSHQHHNTNKRTAVPAEWNPKEHPGCRLSGILLMDRTPGHFYVYGHSPNHVMSPYMTNVSHIVHHLSFGDDRLFHNAPKVSSLPRPSNFDDSTRPMNGNAYLTKDLHEAYHHYLKLVSTNLYSYQIVQSSQLSYYLTDQAPEAKFIIDLSPISVTYRLKTRRWYDYITSLMAILGGTFTVVGMLESGIRAASKRGRRYNGGGHQPPHQQRPRG